MPYDQIPNQARQFIRDRIDSVAQLELLLVLRTNPTRVWSATEISNELRVDSAWARAQLQRMCEQGLLALSHDPAPGYQYQPVNDELALAVTALAEAYLLNRVSVIELIYARPSSTIQSFADAFKLRKGGAADNG